MNFTIKKIKKKTPTFSVQKRRRFFFLNVKYFSNRVHWGTRESLGTAAATRRQYKDEALAPPAHLVTLLQTLS